MSCREFVDFLSDYLDGALSARERASFEAHLEGCEDCVRYLESCEETIRLGKEAFCPEEGVPGDVPEELVRAIITARADGRS
jgi:anti-sigma factor RsiW